MRRWTLAAVTRDEGGNGGTRRGTVSAWSVTFVDAGGEPVTKHGDGGSAATVRGKLVV